MSDEQKPVDEEAGEESFADLFAATAAAPGRLKPGEKVQARVLKIGAEWVFLDIGQKGEGVLDRKEVIDPDGNVTVAEGETITAWFTASSRGELRFTTRIGSTAGTGLAMLEDAWRGGVPVEGFVEKEIKGGFEVKIAGTIRAFCPFSQMALRRIGNSGDYVGKHLPFRITEYGERGRNIVLSHRAILEEQLQQEKELQKESLREGATVTGTVTSLRDFGAFVRVGAVEGLLPVSAIGWGRVTNVADVLAVGQEVTVVVKQADWEREKFSFSLKETMADPWESVVQNFPVGSCLTGTVARLAPFGAFVTLADGIDGLIHISRLGGGKKISHPREVLKEGAAVEVQVEGVDRENRRISLALADVVRATAEAEAEMTAFRQKAAEAPAGMGTLGDLLKAKLAKK